MIRALVVLFLSVPTVAGAQEVLEQPGVPGTWVPVELRRSLERGDRGLLPCLLEVAVDLTATEVCGTERTSWGPGRLTSDTAGTTVVSFAGEPSREVLHRAGVPHEIMVKVGDEDAGQVVRRLYRLAPALEPALESRQLEARLFSGWLQADSGATLQFGNDGRYVWGAERGAYKVDVAGAPAGTSGVLVLTPEGGTQRAYGVTEQAGRIGLSPIAGPWPPPPPPPVRPWAPAGSSGAAVDLGFPAAGAGGSAAVDAGTGGGGEAGPPALAPPSVWLAPATPPPAPAAMPDAGPAQVPDAGPPPIARPIVPRSHCGCSAQGGTLGGGAWVVLALRRRRSQARAGRHPCSAGTARARYKRG